MQTQYCLFVYIIMIIYFESSRFDVHNILVHAVRSDPILTIFQRRIMLFCGFQVNIFEFFYFFDNFVVLRASTSSV